MYTTFIQINYQEMSLNRALQ